MATGGYNASYDESPTGFGSDNMDDVHNSDRGGVSSAPIVGIDLKRNEDLKKMLDSNKDSQKLDAMKLIIGMVAKGRDCSNLFPAVVKNVVSKDPEIKKLVFVYLVRYAEEQQDLALLSISTFQKALKDPNQLIRGSALRVLSSIRVPIIAPIMMLAIKDCVTDMSPYVRKTAANAIPKLYNMDADQKEPLVEVIEKLLKDQTTLVAGSVVMAFEIVCPERIDLIHKNYRKLCNLLVDVDEWGQVVILNMLTRYARSQFIDPNKTVMNDEKFYDSDEESSEEEDSDDDDDDDEEDDDDEKKKKKKKKEKKKVYVMDADHRLLLRVTKPLLQSRNAAVVMAVAQLYHHIAPRNEVSVIARPLIRLLKGSFEVQAVVLSNIATLSAERPSMFEPYLKSFFVRADDPTYVKLSKLDIMANIAGETSIHNILKEFRAYISSSDKQFAAATIQSIGRVACNISEVTETCLHGLTNLLSHKNEAVVAESIIVIKKLLQLQPKENKDLIRMVARLTDKVTIASAKASILWLVGEYCNLVPKIAPDVLRKAAKNFVNEEDAVKLQIINLSAKLIVSNPKQTKLLCQYILNLAKYDQNYDIRDRARFLRKLVLQEGEEESALAKYAKKILMASKPVPVLESNFKSRAKWQLGSLSHFVNSESKGYQSLPDFPEEPPDPTVRNVEDDSFYGRKKGSTGDKKKSFFDDSEESGSEEEFYSSISGSDESDTETEDSDEDSEEEDSDEEEEEEDEDEEDEEDDSSSDEDALENLRKRYLKSKPEESEDDEDDSEEDSDEETDSEEDEDTDSDEEDSEEEVVSTAKHKSKPTPKQTAVKQPKKTSKADPVSLLDLEDWSSTPSVTTTNSPPVNHKDLLQPLSAGMNSLSLSNGGNESSSAITSALPVTVPDTTKELLNRMSSEGLTVKYRFLRKPYIASEKMVAVELTFENTSQSTMSNISIGSSQLQSGMKMNASINISQLAAGGTMTSTIGIDFNDTLQPAKFKISVGGGRQYPVSIDPTVGEIIEAARLSESKFNSLQSKLTGMHESTAKVTLSLPLSAIKNDILNAANVRPIDTSNEDCLKFAALTFSGKLPLLLSLKSVAGDNILITVNCEKMVFGSMICRVAKETIASTL